MSLRTPSLDSPPLLAAQAPNTASRLRLPMHVQWIGGAPSYFVEAEVSGHPVALVLDSAFARSYVTDPLSPETPGAPVIVSIGGAEVLVDYLPSHRPGVAPVAGRPVVGAIGADLLMSATTIIDPERGVIEIRPLTAAERRRVAAMESLALELSPGGYWFARATIDGRERRLWVDTGAGHTLLLRTPPCVGDTPILAQDVLGNPVPLYEGSALLGSGERSRLVSVYRAPNWPDLETRIAGLGERADGLLGLSALGGGRIFIDGPGRRIWIEPPEGAGAVAAIADLYERPASVPSGTRAAVLRSPLHCAGPQRPR